MLFLFAHLCVNCTIALKSNIIDRSLVKDLFFYNAQISNVAQLNSLLTSVEAGIH